MKRLHAPRTIEEQRNLVIAVLAYPLSWFVATRVRIYKAALLTVVLIPSIPAT